MTAVDGIVAVPDMIGGRVGLMTWWRVAATTNFDTLKAEWLKHDLNESELPNLPGDNVALLRALRTCFAEKHCLIRVLHDGVYAVVEEDADDANRTIDPEYEVRFKVWIDMEELEIKFDKEVDEDIADAIFDEFEKARRELRTADMSAWFVRRLAGAVRLRETGGIYFVPETQAAAWTQFADIISKVSGTRIYEVPAMRTERAVEAVMDAVIAETQSEVAALTALLDEKEFTARGLQGKATRCAALAAKLKSYEDLLGVKLSAMQSTIEEVDARIADMILAVE